VRVAAKLGVDAGVGAEREIAGHDGHRAAKESEGRCGHAIVFNGDKLWDAAAHGIVEKMKRIGAAEFGLPDGKLGAGRMFALGLAAGDALAEGEWDGHRFLG
jgi:hypothetical protein